MIHLRTHRRQRVISLQRRSARWAEVSCVCSHDNVTLLLNDVRVYVYEVFMYTNKHYSKQVLLRWAILPSHCQKLLVGKIMLLTWSFRYVVLEEGLKNTMGGKSDKALKRVAEKKEVDWIHCGQKKKYSWSPAMPFKLVHHPNGGNGRGA